MFDNVTVSLVVRWWQRHLPKSVLHDSTFAFHFFFIIILSFSVTVVLVARSRQLYIMQNNFWCDSFIENERFDRKRAAKTTFWGRQRKAQYLKNTSFRHFKTTWMLILSGGSLVWWCFKTFRVQSTKKKRYHPINNPSFLVHWFHLSKQISTFINFPVSFKTSFNSGRLTVVNERHVLAVFF